MMVGDAEFENERLHRLYSALRQIDQAIVRNPTRANLFEHACAALVQQGGFRMAWIGWHDPSTGRLAPVGQAGDETGYLQAIEASHGERPEGDSASARAFRERRLYACNDLREDLTALPFRAELERAGYRSAAAFPLRERGDVGGTLTVYSDRLGFFQDKEVALLSEAAANISLALDNLTVEEARRKSEDVVKRFLAIVESTDDAIVSQALDGTVTSWNPAATGMFGYDLDEVIGRLIDLIIPPERKAEEPAIVDRIRQGERVKHFETVRLRKSGLTFPVSITYSPIWGADQNGLRAIVGVSKIVRDISERKKTEALADREQRFASSLIEAMPGIFYLYDEQGQFLRWNHNFEKVSGYTASEIEKMHPLSFFLPEDRALIAQRIANVFSSGESSAEAAFVAKDGRITPYFFTGRRIILDGASCLVGVGVDITERKRAEEEYRKSEERYRTTLNNILEGCQLLDFDWRYLYLNGAAAVQNRRPNAELLGHRMPDAWPGIEATGVFAMLKRCMEERLALHEEVEFTFLDGTTGWFDVRAQPVPEGIFVLSIDISERKQAEKALRELNEGLELKVRERTLALDAARERAEAADQIKSAFLATMSHELRTPLNSIIGFTGIVLQGMAGPLNGEQSKQLSMVQSSARHLLDLINDVLDISKIEAGQLEVWAAPFDLSASIQRVTDSVRPMIAKKGLTLHVIAPDVLAAMVSDRRRVEQILLNLLNNAIKFTDRGEITLTVEIVGEAAGTAGMSNSVRLHVSDTGIGIDPADLSTLFQPFRQIDSGIQRQHEGTGLGLAICRRLTGLLGGTIRADSARGQGSTFTVELPTKRT